MTLYSENEKRKIIMDYYINPRNRVEDFANKNYQKKYLHSLSCVDEITLFYNDQKNDWKFVANGCVIFLSSCEIFIEKIKDMGFEKKDQLIEIYEKLINNPKSVNDNEINTLDKLTVYENVHKHLNRKECALMISKIFKDI